MHEADDPIPRDGTAVEFERLLRKVCVVCMPTLREVPEFWQGNVTGVGERLVHGKCMKALRLYRIVDRNDWYQSSFAASFVINFQSYDALVRCVQFNVVSKA